MGRDPGQLLTAKTVAEQERIFDEQYSSLFDNRIVRWMGRQPVAVYSLGIPPSQHAAMLEEHDGDGSRLFDMYKQRLRRLACGFPLDDNYFAWQAFGRRYDHEGRKALPDYLKRENYETIKSAVGCVETRIASLADQIRHEKPGSLNSFILLDSQDWMPPPVIETPHCTTEPVTAAQSKIDNPQRNLARMLFFGESCDEDMFGFPRSIT
jgi:S-adenosylmethionine-diacylglycerol 3-amino-3-carboxypropyl transferase